MPNPEARILTAYRSALAEGPLWHSENRAVYWTDILSGTLYRYDWVKQISETIHTGTPIGGFTIQTNGDLLLFRESGAIELLSSNAISVIHPSIPDEVETRFNDVATDPAGRVFCGTMPTSERKGRLYRLDLDRSLTIVLEDVGCSNGIGWSPDETVMYFTDSGEGTIFKFDFDSSTSQISNRSVFYKYPGEGAPDGMTVDAAGNVWTAIWGGSCVIQLDPAGREIRRVAIPAERVTSPAFGGTELTDMFVTTAGGDDPSNPAGAGELILVAPGVKGKPEYRSRIERD